MKRQQESKLWQEILRLWPSAMEYEYLPVSFPKASK